ncbi:MAG: sugar ABC transporter ATP-binding protein [Rubellimicrobium sp.]|nr:sugar ABC transporter ATP-binding protein [Rubellimicrobium sp.]
MTAARDDDPILVARGVTKSFGAVQALKDARLTLARGEIVALLGANGAGKSTLVKILTGALTHDGGDIRIRGQAARMASPGAARRAGLIPVYQEPALIPDLDVGQNLRLGGTPVEPFLRRVAELGVPDLRLDDMIRDLPLASLRILDIARALASQPDVLLLDEVTAALPTDLVERVLRVIRAEADAGRAVIYISHRFSEIAEICDRATVLRDGVTVGDLPIVPGVEEEIVELMLGERLERAAMVAATAAEDTTAPAAAARPRGPVRLSARGLTLGRRVTDLSFDLHAGEVLGVVGLEGQGQDELFEMLAGFRRPDAGTIAVAGQQMRFRDPADAIAAGVTLVPGNRADALAMVRSVRENIALPALTRLRNWGPIPMRAESARVAAAVERLQIDTRAMGEVRRLSGGNQQKVTIGRWVAHGVETLLLFDPTRGIDVRTKRQIYQLCRDLAAGGAAVLYYTSELAEVPQACDRTIVIFGGRLVDEIPAARADEQTLLRAAYGLTARDGARRVPA